MPTEKDKVTKESYIASRILPSGGEKFADAVTG